MSGVRAGLADTSVFIARESGRLLRPLPDQVAVSVVTVGELQLGALVADDPAVRARRADTLALVRTADPIPVSESVMVVWAHLVVACQKAGVARTIKLTDSLIAATAIDRGLPVLTQDDDFEQMRRAHAGLHVEKV